MKLIKHLAGRHEAATEWKPFYLMARYLMPLLGLAITGTVFIPNLAALPPDQVSIDWTSATGDKPRLRFPTDENLRYGIEKAVSPNIDGSLQWFGLTAFDGSATGFTEWTDDDASSPQAFYRITQPVRLPEISTYAIFGDSRANQCGLRPSEGAVGLTYWINLALGRRLTCLENLTPQNGSGPRYAFSQGGQYFVTLEDDAGLYPRVAECIAAAPDLVIVYCGTNALNKSVPAEFEAFKRVTTRFRNAGIKIIAISEPYFGESRAEPDYSEEVDLWNSLIGPYCESNNIPLLDGNTPLNKAPGDSHDYFFQADGSAWVHPNVRGASEIGVAVARTIDSRFTLPPFPIDSTTLAGTPTLFPSFDNGTVGNGSNSWGSTWFNSDGTIEFSKRSDGQPGNWLKVTTDHCLEGGPTSTEGGGGYYKLWQTLRDTSLPPDGSYKFVAEIKILDWPESIPEVGESNARLIQATLSVGGGVPAPKSTCGLVTSDILYQPHTLGERGSASPIRGAVSNRVAIASDKVRFSSAEGNTTFSVALTFYGNMTVCISNCGLIRCD